MTQGNRKAEAENAAPTEVEKLLDLELAQKRAAWAQTKARGGTIRLVSYLFLLVVVLGAFGALVFALSADKVRKVAPPSAEKASLTPSPAEGSR